MIEPNKYYQRESAAKFLGITAAQIDELVNSGRLKGTRAGDVKGLRLEPDPMNFVLLGSDLIAYLNK